MVMIAFDSLKFELRVSWIPLHHPGDCIDESTCIIWRIPSSEI